MADDRFLASLASKLSPSSTILSDEKSPAFAASMERWSDYGVETPFAIVQPKREEDIVRTVQEAVRASVPFVPKSGGHSPWSTVGQGGIVIDLSQYKGITNHVGESLTTVKGGTLIKELQMSLHPSEQFAAVGNGNTIGVIPFYLGGGIGIYAPLIGYGSENIVSAKLVSAGGELIEVSESRNPELLWGIRGAGQFLGLVTELTIRTYPYSLLGNAEGQHLSGTYVFAPQQLEAVCAAIKTAMEVPTHVSAGHLTIMQAPPDLELLNCGARGGLTRIWSDPESYQQLLLGRQQVLVVTPQVFSPPDEAARIFRLLMDVGPIQDVSVVSAFDSQCDHLDPVCAKGDFKRASQMGLAGWDVENIKKLVAIHAELVTDCPDAARSAFTVEYLTPRLAGRELKSSFGHEDVDCWLNVMSWYTDAANHDFVAGMDQKARAVMRAGTEEEAFVSYTNTNRPDPLEHRYKGSDRIARLRALKRQLDPTGVFTRELL